MNLNTSETDIKLCLSYNYFKKAIRINMKTKLSFLPQKSRILIVFLIAFHMQAFSQDNLSKLFESALPSVLKIETFDENNRPLMSGTGFFISPKGKCISNLHIFRGAFKSKVTTPSGESYPIDSIWYKSDSLDLVTFTVVKQPNKVFPFLNIDKNVPKIGEDVFVIGNPIGLDFTVSNGIISSVRTQSGLGQILQTSAPISAGSSGSPLINMNGLVVGVITFTFTEGQNLNFAISLIDKKLSNEFKSLDLNKISETITNTNANPNWVNDAYGIVRGFHAAMCENWRFNIEFKRNMTQYPNFKWDVNIKALGRTTPLESHVQGYHDGEIVGTTIMFAVNKNLTYVISYGIDNNIKPTANYSLILVSRIANGDVTYIFNSLVEKIRLQSLENRFLEQTGNSKISMIIEDKWFVRQIYLEDNLNPISSNGETYYLNSYDFK